MTQVDLQNYLMKFGNIRRLDVKFEAMKAIVTYSSCKEASLAASIPKFVIKGHSIWCKPNKYYQYQGF